MSEVECKTGLEKLQESMVAVSEILNSMNDIPISEYNALVEEGRLYYEAVQNDGTKVINIIEDPLPEDWSVRIVKFHNTIAVYRSDNGRVKVVYVK